MRRIGLLLTGESSEERGEVRRGSAESSGSSTVGRLDDADETGFINVVDILRLAAGWEGNPIVDTGRREAGATESLEPADGPELLSDGIEGNGALA